MTAPAELDYDPRQQQTLMEEIWANEDDWLYLAGFLFPWRDASKPLAQFRGPRIWQCEMFEAISAHRRAAKALLTQRAPHKEVLDELTDRRSRTPDGTPAAHALEERLATQRELVAKYTPDPFAWTCRSGHGTGKDAFLAMFAVIFLSVCRGASYITTANTEPQLMSKTLPELGKWFRLAHNAHWWNVETMIVRPAKWYKKHLEEQLSLDCKKFFAQGLTWDEHNAEAFTGEHNWNGMAFAKSECSGIADTIWDAVDGAFTEPIVDRYDLNVGNPWRTTGRFHESHHKNRHLYRTLHLDTRKVEDTDPGFEKRIRTKHGVDSVQYTVQVKGDFPTDADERFIKPEIIEGAKARKLEPDPGAPLVLGIDVARMGPDSSAGVPRRGLDIRSIEPVVFNKRDLAWLTDAFEEYIIHLLTLGLRRVFIDGIGMGAGVADHLVQRFVRAGYVGLIVVIDSVAEDPEDPQYHNKTSELWGVMRDALKLASLGDGDGEWARMHSDLGDRLDGTDKRSGKIRIESKDEMRDRGLRSPDVADALASTYYAPVPRDSLTRMDQLRPQKAQGLDYRPGQMQRRRAPARTGLHQP